MFFKNAGNLKDFFCRCSYLGNLLDCPRKAFDVDLNVNFPYIKTNPNSKIDIKI